MARYCLLLKCVLDPSKTNGAFVNDPSYPMWVSPDKNTDGTLWTQDPDVAPLTVKVGDTVNFAVKVVDTKDALVGLADLQNPLLAVMISAKGPRDNPDANSFSPFRYGTAVQVLKLAGAPTVQGYSFVCGNGLPGPNPEYLAFDDTQGDAKVVDDGRTLSQFKYFVCFYTQPKGGGFYQFSYDPEMDTQGGGNS